MARSILQLTANDLSRALDDVKPVDWLAGELAGRAVGGQRESDVLVNPGRVAVAAPDRTASDVALVEDERTGARCVLSIPGLRACRAAALSGLAARLLLAPGVVTVAILGDGAAVTPHLIVMAHHQPRIGRIAVVLDTAGHNGWLDPAALDQVDLAGIQLIVTTDVSSADLVVVVAVSAKSPDIGALKAGAVVVNATNRDLPDELVAAVHQLYVDDATLIEHHTNRCFVRRHLAGNQPIEADLGQVLTGTHPGRTHEDQTLLVELLGADTPDPRLARVLHRAAVNRGLGSYLYE